MSGQRPEATGEVHERLDRLDDRTKSLLRDRRWKDAAMQDLRVAAVESAFAVGLLVLLAATWLTPSPPDELQFYGPRTGLGLLDGEVWTEDEMFAQTMAIAGLLVYIAAAIIALATVEGGRVPVIAAAAGLVATIGVVLAKPGNDAPVTYWDFAWQAPPYIACAFWVVLICLAGWRSSHGRR
jgi:sugar phosphate permease